MGGRWCGVVGRLAFRAAAGCAVVVFAAATTACQRAPQESPPGPLAPPLAAASSAQPASSQAVAVASASVPTESRPAPACGDPGDIIVFASPEHPSYGQPIRFVVVSDHVVDAQLTVTPPAGS
ncbi:MAG TPA: hypothetical protein VIF15_17575, partial [Polyangiaceae bacterium]